jgi:hypothetical protein
MLAQRSKIVWLLPSGRMVSMHVLPPKSISVTMPALP